MRPQFHDGKIFPVDAHRLKQGIRVVDRTNFHPNANHQSTPTSLRQVIQSLPDSLIRIIGDIHIPSDDGTSLFQHIQLHNLPLFGASDASIQDGHSTHAWILSSGNTDDIEIMI